MPATAENINRRIMVHAGLGQEVGPYLQNNQSKRVRGVAQAVEHLPSKHEAQYQHKIRKKKRKSNDVQEICCTTW
jgi:hypothetical protein